MSVPELGLNAAACLHLRTSKPVESSRLALRIACPLLKEHLPHLRLMATCIVRAEPPHAAHARQMSIFSAISMASSSPMPR